jgi:phosphoglycerate dehydrogenase-like enzyme
MRRGISACRSRDKLTARIIERPNVDPRRRMTSKILIVDPHAEIYRDRLAAEFPALDLVTAASAAGLPRDVADIDAFIGFGMDLNDEFFRQAARLKWVQCLATGVDHLLRRPTLRPDVILTSGRGIHGAPMRELIVYLMMGAGRDVRRLAADQAAHHWDRRYWSVLSGKTAVIVGTGVIGSATAQLLKAFGMTVIGVTRMPRAEAGFDEMVPLAALEQMARRADYLINILPATAENALRFNGAVFAAMKPTAFYISAGRGQTVDEDALIGALRERRIAGAGMDVFQTEPLPASSPFWDLPNVFITPHLGGYVVEYEELVLPTIIGNMRAFLAGKPDEMKNRINR